LFAVAAIYGFKYLDDNFSAGGLIRQGNEIAHDSGCEAAMPTYDRAVSYGGTAAHFARGNCEFRLNKTDAALADYSETIRSNPAASGALFNRGLVYRALGRPAEALADWAAAVRATPTDAAPSIERAKTFREIGQFDDALRAYDDALKAGADANETRLHRAEVMRDKGDYAAALAEYDVVMKADADGFGSRAYFERAAVLRLQGDLARATEVVDDGLTRWPKNAFGLYQRGLLELFVQDRPDAAAQDLSFYFTTGKDDMLFSMVISEGAEALGGAKADERPMFAAGTPLAPIAYDAAVYL
jgi:tetratricopeptide (TPR) repeat protein